MKRRSVVAWLGSLCLPARAIAAGARGETPERRFTPYAPVVPGYRIRFPEDEGSHPDFRTEWWYVTGWLQRRNRPAAGFQITFFRTRPRHDESNPSAFTPRQIIIAHAALSERSRGRLVHDQRVARAAFGLAGADTGRTAAWIDNWSLVQHDGAYRARIAAREFALDLEFVATQPPLLQGEAGFSRKGPQPQSASYYYSIPQLRVGGRIRDAGAETQVTGSAWLDHEWSSSYMDERAAGWDWIGINFDDGSALMAFRMRHREGGALWAGGAHRNASGARLALGPTQVEFAPLRRWRSPRTGATYPVAWRVRAGDLDITLEPLMDDQESDTRASVGAVYWEGAVTALVNGNTVGRGYLELTGYDQPMRL